MNATDKKAAAFRAGMAAVMSQAMYDGIRHAPSEIKGEPGSRKLKRTRKAERQNRRKGRR